MRRVRGIREVAEGHLCCGCGACAYVQPDAVSMVDVLDEGRRPIVATREGHDVPTDDALRACPGVGLTHPVHHPPGTVAELVDGWGPVLELWEGHAADPDLQWNASSGGAASALALHAIEADGFHGILHIAARRDVPYLNHTVLSRSRAEMLAATGSRYAPASPCDRLDEIERAPGPCVMIGKPCDVAGARMAAELRPGLAARLGLTVAVFCAGTPSTRGTLEMAARMGFAPGSSVQQVRYRGKGWPGRAQMTAVEDGARAPRTESLSYDESWGDILQRHRQWRCYVCADHTGEFADVAVGDPWYREIPDDEPGLSLVVARTERGRRAIRAALDDGYLVAERVEPAVLPASQPNLLQTRGAVWGRSVALRMAGVRTPRYRRLPTFRIWWRALRPKQKAQSVYGTLRRVRRKRLRQPADLTPLTPAGSRLPAPDDVPAPHEHDA